MVQDIISKEIYLKPFFARYPHTTYERGERILRPNNLTATIIFVKSGYVKIYRTSKEGKEITINIINSALYNILFFGISTYIKRYSVSALTETEVITIPKKDFFTFLSKNPEAYTELLPSLLRNLENMYGQIDILKNGNAYNKIASTIYYLGKETGDKNKKSVKLGFRITHQMIANLTGLTRETVTVQLNKLKAKQYIDYEENVLKINDVDNLENLIKEGK
jgi:CRP/FNR family transcriptional regulator, cyclic AMP receptor protein